MLEQGTQPGTILVILKYRACVHSPRVDVVDLTRSDEPSANRHGRIILANIRCLHAVTRHIPANI